MKTMFQPNEGLRELRVHDASSKTSLTPAFVEQAVSRAIETILGFVPDIDESLFAAGLDSLSVVDLRQELVSSHPDLQVEETFFYDRPTFREICSALLDTSHSTAPLQQLSISTSDLSIEIVGVGCRLPGSSDSVASFWRALMTNRSELTPLKSQTRWNHDDWHSDDVSQRGKYYCTHAGLLPPSNDFDHAFFGLTQQEAQKMDPQQRLALEVTVEAIEDAGLSYDTLSGKNVGVFFAATDDGWLSMQDPDEISPFTATGASSSIVSNRISFNLNMIGPSMTIDTACSSSLVALDLASSAIRAGKCDMAIVGAVNMLLTPAPFIATSKARMLSKRGACATFGIHADGYVRAEGCGVVVLAAADLDDYPKRYCRLGGSAVGQDGKSASLTSPTTRSQIDVIQRAHAAAGVTRKDVQYVEAHGTGTPLGDPIELSALEKTFYAGNERLETMPLLGAVKANIGHLEVAAGIAGLIKACCIFVRGQAPQNIHAKQLNPKLQAFANHFDFVQHDSKTLQPRNIGVSSFGFGGTNAHVILSACETAANFDLAEKRVWAKPTSESKTSLTLQEKGVLSQVSWLEVPCATAAIDETLDSLEYTELKLELTSLGYQFEEHQWSSFGSWLELSEALEKQDRNGCCHGVGLKPSSVLLETTGSSLMAFDLTLGSVWAII